MQNTNQAQVQAFEDNLRSSPAKNSRAKVLFNQLCVAQLSILDSLWWNFFNYNQYINTDRQYGGRPWYHNSSSFFVILFTCRKIKLWCFDLILIYAREGKGRFVILFEKIFKVIKIDFLKFWWKRLFGKKKCQKNVGQFFLAKQNLGQNFLGSKKHFCWKIFESEFFCAKKIWVRNFFGSKKKLCWKKI